jgi:hypothetical protein
MVQQVDHERDVVETDDVDDDVGVSDGSAMASVDVIRDNLGLLGF